LKALGVNLNLGPVVDLARNRQNPIVARLGRSFGTDPKSVSAFARAFIRAHRQAGVLTAAKHFPGHGSSTEDSHLRAIDLTRSWNETELDPYKMLFATEPPPLVMVGHLHLERFDAKAKTPASLSKDAIEGLLRREIGYTGAVITDDLDMGAIRGSYRLEDAVVLAVTAGADMVLLSNTSRPDSALPERLIARIRAAILDGTIPQRRIEEAYQRIVALKRKLGVAAPVVEGSR
jgi:beta-N-acetylhexosaminidase